MEDAVEGEKKSMQDKVESLESVVRMLELKVKNSSDHGKSIEKMMIQIFQGSWKVFILRMK